MILIIVVAIVAVMSVIIVYNGLISRKNQVENAFASIDTMLKKRYDLIPNLVSAVQTYMQHERGVLNDLTEIRAKALSGSLTNDEKVDLDNKLSKSLGGIMVAVENYPDLKADQNFMQLQTALNEVEEQISAARRAYNAAVTAYNNAIEMFPSNMLAGIMSYERKKVFDIPDKERGNINIGDLFDKK